MYVTRPLSLYKNNNNNSNGAPLELEGPNIGVLVIDENQGKERDKRLNMFPFPQNKWYNISHNTIHFHLNHNHNHHFGHHHHLHVMLIPVLNSPSNSNQYYIIKLHGSNRGLAYTSFGDEANDDGCCYNIFMSVPPKILDPKNPYQQYKFDKRSLNSNCFKATSVAPDGIPPNFIANRSLRVHANTLKNFNPTPALGLDVALRARLPNINSQPVVVGKWYCPFIFIKDGKVSSQIQNSPYYEMTLHQYWEPIYEEHNKVDRELVNGNDGVRVDVCVTRQAVIVEGSAAKRAGVDRGVMLFGTTRTGQVGLNMAIVERMKWEEERGGFKWSELNEEQERVERIEKFKEVGEWKRFKCYILVEKFVLKRMDGSVVLTWEFRHTHQIRIKWE